MTEASGGKVGWSIIQSQHEVCWHGGMRATKSKVEENVFQRKKGRKTMSRDMKRQT